MWSNMCWSNLHSRQVALLSLRDTAFVLPQGPQSIAVLSLCGRGVLCATIPIERSLVHVS